MVMTTTESINTKLACKGCGEKQEIILNRALSDELGRRGEVRIFCSICETTTSWSGIQSDRRSGLERRKAPQARLALPICIRCEHPALQFIEVTATLTASRKGASLCTGHPLLPGMNVFVVLPFNEADPKPIESVARIIWVEKKGSGWEVGIEFQG